MIMEGGPQIPKERTLVDWTVNELKDKMFRLAHEDPNVLRPLEKIPKESYGAHAEYNAVYAEGRTRAINFEIGHNILCSLLLSQ